jgi:hypothetical protein
LASKDRYGRLDFTKSSLVAGTPKPENKCMGRSPSCLLLLGLGCLSLSAWSDTGPPTLLKKATLNKARHDGSGSKVTPKKESAPKQTDAFARNQLADRMDQILAYAARCPSQADFLRNSATHLKNIPSHRGLNAESCNELDMGRLTSYRHMRDMQRFYKNLNIENDLIDLPLESVANALRRSCRNFVENNEVSTDSLSLLYTLACKAPTPPEDTFTGVDYSEALHNPSHEQHQQAQRQIDQYATDFSDSNFKPITSNGWDDQYDETLRQSLSQSPLLNPSLAMQKDLRQICPAFNSLSPDDKIRMWSGIFDAMAMAESAHKPNTTFRESFGPLSTGMLQISEVSARGHHSVCRRARRAQCGCAEASTDLLKGPQFNLACGVTIMENQMSTGRGLFGNRSYYWSVLNTTQNGFPKVMGRLNAIKSSQKWPAACGR